MMQPPPSVTPDRSHGIQRILYEFAAATSRSLIRIQAILEEEDDRTCKSTALRQADTIVDLAEIVSEHPPDRNSFDLRGWFLRHLAHPYPSAEEKAMLAESMGTTMRAIDSHLTNWRRRAGWSEIKRKWGGNCKDGMIALVTAYNSGEEQRPDVRAAIKSMRGYFEDCKVGDWVQEVVTTQVTPQARPKRQLPKRTVPPCGNDQPIVRSIAVPGKRSFSASSQSSIDTVSSSASDVSRLLTTDHALKRTLELDNVESFVAAKKMKPNAFSEYCRNPVSSGSLSPDLRLHQAQHTDEFLGCPSEFGNAMASTSSTRAGTVSDQRTVLSSFLEGPFDGEWYQPLPQLHGFFPFDPTSNDAFCDLLAGPPLAGEQCILGATITSNNDNWSQ